MAEPPVPFALYLQRPGQWQLLPVERLRILPRAVMSSPSIYLLSHNLAMPLGPHQAPCRPLPNGALRFPCPGFHQAPTCTWHNSAIINSPGATKSDLLTLHPVHLSPHFCLQACSELPACLPRAPIRSSRVEWSGVEYGARPGATSTLACEYHHSCLSNPT